MGVEEEHLDIGIAFGSESDLKTVAGLECAAIFDDSGVEFICCIGALRVDLDI